MDTTKVGRWAFILGLVISVVAGFVNLGSWGVPALIILGVIVGLLNVTGKEVMSFLMATVALMIVGTTIWSVAGAWPVLQTILSHFVSFVAGAAFIVALREVLMTTSSQ